MSSYKDLLAQREKLEKQIEEAKASEYAADLNDVASLDVMLGALIYFYAVDKRGEGPSRETAPPPAAQVQGGAQTAPTTAPTAPQQQK